MLRIITLALAGYLIYLILKRFFVKFMTGQANQFSQNSSFEPKRKPVENATETDFVELDSKIKSDPK